MRILITGAAGMIGQKLVKRLAANGSLGGRQISALQLQDVVAPADIQIADVLVTKHVGDLADPSAAEALVATRPDVVFHLAGVVSGEAESNFELGYRVNVEASRLLFEAIRALAYRPKVVFSSSSAAFGGPFPGIVPDTFHLTPLTSYGTQKMIVEGLLADYTRRGFIDGIGIRLPTICVRPGKPNLAASGFKSGLIREPLNGIPALLPVPRSFRGSSVSPRSAVNFLLHAAELDGERVGPRRNLSMPAVICTVEEQIEALRRVAGDDVIRLIQDEPDETIWRIVQTWPQGFEATRARELGFKSESDFDEIIRIYIEEDLPTFRQHQSP